MMQVGLCRLCRHLLPRTSSLQSMRTTGTPRSIYSSSALLATKGERQITKLLTEKLTPSYVEVRDISGGCGSMYEISIDSEQFSGKRLIQQHRMVNEALGDDVVKSLHGLTIKVGNPKSGG